MRNPVIRDCKVRRINYSCSDATSGGFTLLEVLLALAIFSILIAALYSTFFLSHRAVDAVDDSLLRLQEARAIVDLLKRELESAVYDPTKLSNNQQYTVFKLDDRDFYDKEASQLLFTSFSPLLPGLARIAYTVDEDNGKLTLKKKILSAYAQKDVTTSVGLMEEIESFTVEVRSGGLWGKTWDSTLTNAMPDAIRISLKVAVKKGKDLSSESTSPDSFTITDIAIPRYNKIL
ncbi:MAG TPA: hypothetical protein DCP92_22450 [Nitrospiraceae bacterium]|nr:hypothetical protein [Nitrospiraceae bacterium]